MKKQMGCLLPTVKTVEIRRQFKTRPGKNPDTLAVELRQFSCRPEEKTV